jgi:hypothetical protein
MTKKKGMPPELLAHFKKKNEEGSEKGEKEKGDKERRRDAVKKARVRLEGSKRKRGHDKEEATGEGRSEAS